MIIKPVSIAELFGAPNFANLVKENALECSIPQIGDINPQVDMYAMMETSGMLQPFGVYNNNALIGFGTVLSYVLPHYGNKIATSESLFLSERNSHAGFDLMDTMEQFAKCDGCIVFLWNARTGSRFERLLTARKNYERTNSVFCRSL